MQDWLSAQARAQPNALALVCGTQVYTFVQLHQHASQMAAGLATLGVKPRTRVGLLLGNVAQAVVAIHAVARLGATLVLLNTRLTPDEIHPQITRTNCSMLLCTQDTAALAAALPAPSLRFCVDGKSPEHIPLLSDVAAAHGEYDRGQVTLEDEAAILFTSGTSGTPKAAVLTWGNFWHSAIASAFRIGTLPNDRWLCVLPLFHVGGLSIILRACLYGSCVDLHHKFEIEPVRHALATQPITLVSLVPTQLHRLLALPLPAPQLRLALLGGAAVSPQLMAAAQAAGLPIATTYGLTEAASQVATLLPAAAARKPSSVGKPLLFTDVKLVDEHDQPVRTGDYGEVCVRGATVQRGYLDDPAANANAFRQGWFCTGDIGFVDEDGDLHLVQRRSDLIISGGENVYPTEVENVLRQHSAIQDCAVLGIDSAEWGQQVAAWVVLHSHLPAPNLADLLAFCRARLAGYKLPRQFRFVAHLPTNAAGKIDRKALLATSG